MSYAYQFWKRVDARLAEMQIGLNDLSAKTNINYGSMRGWRSKDRTPGAEEIVAIARCLEVSTDSLLMGESARGAISEEARLVDEDPDLRALVRVISRDRSLLRVISAVVTSSEKAMGAAR